MFLELLLALDAGGADGGKIRSVADTGEKWIIIHRRVAAIVLLHGAAKQSQGYIALAEIGISAGDEVLGFRVAVSHGPRLLLTRQRGNLRGWTMFKKSFEKRGASVGCHRGGLDHF